MLTLFLLLSQPDFNIITKLVVAHAMVDEPIACKRVCEAFENVFCVHARKI